MLLEGLIIACLLMLTSGYYGPEIWTSKASSLLGFDSTLGDLTFLDLWVPILTAGVFVGHLPLWYAPPPPYVPACCLW